MLLKALSTMCKSCAGALQTLEGSSLSPSPATPTSPVPDQIASAVLAQCRKKDVAYKTAALECLGDVLEVLEVDVFSQLFEEIVSPILKQVSLPAFTHTMALTLIEYVF